MIFQLFPNTNAWGRKFDLTVKRSKVTLRHNLNKLGNLVFDAVYQDLA